MSMMGEINLIEESEERHFTPALSDSSQFILEHAIRSGVFRAKTTIFQAENGEEAYI